MATHEAGPVCQVEGEVSQPAAQHTKHNHTETDRSGLYAGQERHACLVPLLKARNSWCTGRMCFCMVEASLLVQHTASQEPSAPAAQERLLDAARYCRSVKPSPSAAAQTQQSCSCIQLPSLQDQLLLLLLLLLSLLPPLLPLLRLWAARCCSRCCCCELSAAAATLSRPLTPWCPA
jgi:hypothetical protein